MSLLQLEAKQWLPVVVAQPDNDKKRAYRIVLCLSGMIDIDREFHMRLFSELSIKDVRGQGGSVRTFC